MTKVNFHNIEEEEKKAIFQEISNQTGIPAFAVEKDWWIVQSLSIIFETDISEYLVFKGGTSLSKAWGLIERFSEDVDLAVDRTFFGFKGDLGKYQRTKLRKAASKYISETLFPELVDKFKKRGLTAVDIKIIEPQSSDQDPRIIEIYYPYLIESPGYIKPRVQIEIGSRSMREPFTLRSFSSLIDESYPNTDFANKEIEIPTVNPERTFLEKIFLLHEEFQRPEQKIRVDRLSRHLYDIYQLSKTQFAVKAIADKDLYETIVRHRQMFTRVGGVNYNLHQPQSINPIPTKKFIDAFKIDYKTMQEQMIYGTSPDFDELIDTISTFVKKLNKSTWVMDIEFPTPQNN